MSQDEAQPAGFPRWRMAAAVFALLLGFHAWAVSGGWKNGNLPGHEFRQTQTAMSALFIQRGNDFSLAYPTPVLGQPWSIPMEFPLYQWTVVKVSNWTGLPLIQAGRTVSAACFYVALAALWPLLGLLGLAAGPRLVAMGLVLTCPLYIFYARAFLIETMVLMFSLWFLVAFGRMITAPGWKGLVAAAVLGTAAGLVKVTTFSVYLLAAAGWTLIEMRRQHATAGIGGAIRRAAWAVGAIVGPIAVTLAWTRFADGVKRQNSLADILVSGNLTNFNFGNAQNRFSAETLGSHWTNLSQNLAGPVLLVGALLLLVTVSRRWWPQVALCLGFYVAPLVAFPTLYAWHDYYAMANAVLLLAGLGVAVAGAMTLRPAWLPWLLLLGLHASQVWTYHARYYEWQRNVSPGGSDMTHAVNCMTDPDEVLVVTGYDWGSSVPFYSGRRAVMIRHGMERDRGYLENAFRAQAGLPVTVLVVREAAKQDPMLLDLAVRHFDLDPRPLFQWQDTTVFGRKDLRARMVGAVRAEKTLVGVELDASTKDLEWTLTDREVKVAGLLQRDRVMFRHFTPEPEGFHSQFGSYATTEAGKEAFFAHAPTRVWFAVPAGRHTVRVECAVQAGAYAGAPADHTDGVEFVIERELPDGKRERLAARLLDPSRRPEDAGWQTLEAAADFAAPGRVVVSTGPGPAGSFTRDWAVLGAIKID